MRGLARVVVAGMPAATWWLGKAAWRGAAAWWGADSPGAAGAGAAPGRSGASWWSAPGDAAALADTLPTLVAAVGAPCAAYLTFAAFVGLVTRLAGRPRLLGPRAWRAVVATAFGTGVIAGLATPATAAEAPSPAWADAPTAAAGAGVADLSAPVAWDTVSLEVSAALPERTPPAESVEPPAEGVEPPPAPVPELTSSLATEAPALSAGEPALSAYVVQPGDSLWLITAALLGEGAPDATIASAWPALYAANRDAIGADPDLIHPGLALTIPAELLA